MTQGDWKPVWGERMPREVERKLYNLKRDRCETTNLADSHPERVKLLAAQWERYARRTGRIPTGQ